jgi:hypothetical protein
MIVVDDKDGLIKYYKLGGLTKIPSYCHRLK